VVAIGFLLIVVLPMTYIYYMYSTSAHSTTMAATPAGHTGARAAQSTSAPGQTPADSVQSTITSGSPILADSLASNTNDRWSNDGTKCLFSGGAYHDVVNQANYLQPCNLQSAALANATFQVYVSLLSGHNAGMLLRVGSGGESFYDFEINSAGQFFFRRHDAGSGALFINLVPPTSHSAVLRGSQKNALLVIAKGNDFKLYINGTFVNEVQDSTYVLGGFALVAGTYADVTTADARFVNLKIFNS
jgi:hypothetical protein